MTGVMLDNQVNSRGEDLDIIRFQFDLVFTRSY